MKYNADPGALPTVSVIIPTHDRCTRVRVAIESVLVQACPALELIVVDDGSSDGTAQMIRDNYPQVHLLQQANAGVSSARNRGIQVAMGDWIAFLDSDDRWYEHKLEHQLNALQVAPGVRLCHCDEHWIRNGRRVNPKHRHRKYGGRIFSHCLPLCAISPSAVMIKRTLLAECGGFDESLPACEDYDLWLRITVDEPVLYLDEALLEKTGGHPDQLSSRYPAMDRFRLASLARLIRSGRANHQQAAEATRIFREKFHIWRNGALKRDLHDDVHRFEQEHTDLLI